MKKILIVSQSMEIGGAEKSLLGILNSIDYSLFQIDLFLCRQEGDLLKYVPKEVNILPMNQSQYLAVPIIQLIKKRQWKIFYGRLKAKLLAKKTVLEQHLSNDNQVELTYSHKYTYKYFDFINPDVEYDLAISFLAPHYICIHTCKSKKKVAWIHTDYSTIDIDIDTELEMWDCYDKIVSISDKCTDAFLSKVHVSKSKIIRIDNIITKEMVDKQSNDFFPKEIKKRDNEIVLCSVGRFSYAKNFDNIPYICSKIIKNGLNVKWYIIGYGNDEKLIRRKIEEEAMEQNVIILGKKLNPYPYIKNCDYYIQPSRYEGKAVTVREAQLLTKLVIITDFPTAGSQVNDGVDGIIVPMENDKCAREIVNFIKDFEKQKKIINNLKIKNYSNELEIRKIYKLAGDKNEKN